jgi:group II intron reverse transcriptase/maturase
VRRTYIAKPDGGERALGIATLEDKVLQRAVAEVLNAVYETDFRGFSYGFRAGRKAHDALDALAAAIRRGKVSWVLDADIKSYFDTIDQELLMRCVRQRIGDERILRLIQKWLKAGVMEDAVWRPTEEGTPQGATISPLLANLYLHYVFDQWADAWRRRHARGEVYIVRYADDFIVCFQYQADAERFLTDLRARLESWHLSLHPDKTRLIEFGRFAAENRQRRGEGKPETFDFLGFTHICGKNRYGGFLLRRQTVAKRARRKLKELKNELRKRMHASIPSQGAWLRRGLQGYFNYFAVPTNLETLRKFRTQVARHWQRTLSRRSQKGRVLWDAMQRRVDRWLPPVQQLHPFPDERFSRRRQRRHLEQEPSAGILHAGI